MPIKFAFLFHSDLAKVPEESWRVVEKRVYQLAEADPNARMVLLAAFDILPGHAPIGLPHAQ